MDLMDITCSNQQQAEDLLVLLQNCKRLSVRQLNVSDDGVGAEAWAVLAKAVELHPGKCRISATRNALLAGRRKDLKVLWGAVRSVEVMYSEAFASDGDVFIEKEEGWGRLEQVLDMSEDQWQAEARANLEEYEETEEDAEEEEEDEKSEKSEKSEH